MIGLDDIAIAGGWAFLKRNWKPLLLGGVGLAAALYIWILRGDVADLKRDVIAAEKGEQAAKTERDIWQQSAESQAAGAREAHRVVEGQRKQIEMLTTAWRSTRADAEKVAAKTKSTEARYRAIIADMTEKSNAEGADPIELAIDGLRRLCREQQAGDPTTPGAC